MSPYRTPSPMIRRPRPRVHLARVVLHFAGESWWSLVFPSPYEWQWIRRAIGGEWEFRCYVLLPGAPTVWSRHRDTSGPGTYEIVDREVWP